MTGQELRPLKRWAAWACILIAGLVTGSICFIALVSIWEGFRHIDRSGSWVPMMAGILALGLSLWVYIQGARAFHRRLNRRDDLLDL